MCPSKHLRLRLGLQLRHVKSRDVEALAVITTTVARPVVVDNTRERDEPRPRDVVDAMREDERKRNHECSKPKEEVDKKRVIYESIKPRQTQNTVLLTRRSRKGQPCSDHEDREPENVRGLERR